jgi:hypothetical protein
VGTRTGLGAEAGGKIPCPCWGSNPGSPVIKVEMSSYKSLSPLLLKFINFLFWNFKPRYYKIDTCRGDVSVVTLLWIQQYLIRTVRFDSRPIYVRNIQL